MKNSFNNNYFYSGNIWKLDENMKATFKKAPFPFQHSPCWVDPYLVIQINHEDIIWTSFSFFYKNKLGNFCIVRRTIQVLRAFTDISSCGHCIVYCYAMLGMHGRHYCLQNWGRGKFNKTKSIHPTELILVPNERCFLSL